MALISGQSLIDVDGSCPRTDTLVSLQREHHQHVSFKDEFRELCRRHGLTLDERYVWT